MANNKTDAMEKEVLTFYLRPGDTAPVRPSTLFLALFTSDPSEAGVTTGEVATASGYARQAITFTAPAAGGASQVSNTATISFGPASAGWGSITHTAVCRSGTQGATDILYFMPIATPQTILVNQYIDFAVGAVVVSEE